MFRSRPVFSAALGTVAGILILASGCAEQVPTTVQLRPAEALSAARAYSAGTYTAIIGPSGGILKLPVGRIVFPAGAVDAETRISAWLDGRKISATFSPHGLTFAPGKEPSIEFDFGGLNVRAGRLQIVYLDDQNNIIETLITTSASGTATASLQHFSIYALSEAEP